MSVRATILESIAEITEGHLLNAVPEGVTAATRLPELGFDSVAYMALISVLEEKLGFIPEGILDGAKFPETIGELIQIYDAENKATS